MAKPHQEIDHDLDLDHPWSTWEELLLACAVNRHGTKSWDFVAMEVQSRISSPLLLNAHNCRRKYHDLERRFMTVDPQSNGGDHTTTTQEEKTVLWVQQLTKLRVAELKRDVQRSDLSIVSLQQKVKKLKQEQEYSLQEKENENEKSDLHKCSNKIRGGADEKTHGESEKSSPVDDVAKRISGIESDRESNFSDPKCKTSEIGPEAVRKPEEAAETAAGETDPVPGKPVGGEASYDGSSETARAANGEAASIPVPDAGDSAEFPESVAESEGGGGERAGKENSDVQSSASLSRKRQRRKAAPGNSSGDEPDVDEVSPARKRLSVKSQRSHRLARLLEVIRSHKHCSVFERRLQSQESTNYRNLIRQHVDLEMIKTKLDEGLYSNSSLQFFRDLLLLFNNTIVFFPKNSTESIAAIELRDIISKKMITATRSRSKPISNQKPHPPSRKPSPPIQPLPKPNPNPSGPVAACRKRSSISVKAPLRLPALEAKRSRPDVVKSDPQRDEPDDNHPTKNLSKQRTRERSSLRTRGAMGHINKSSKSSNGALSNHVLSSNSIAREARSLREDPTDKKRKKMEKENAIVKKKNKMEKENATVKKNSVANFLNQMKRSSGSSSPPVDTLKESVNGSGRGRGELGKGGKGGEVRRDQPVRNGSSGKKVQGKGNPGRRSVGRPPKKVPPPQQKMPPPPPRKAREKVEVEVKPHSKRPRR
ncbi:SANT/Myb domain-containing protein [Cinnamomum micranthum f. kanehirae]|uniref:SANT/Myb domain-containing protein n=1 Tax=Cinnamomum micranthum f. kanehirae TaxID=337451 RepID=A0A3S3MA79_9MAGN|nr:SANT/Myb domain-containing protein [Cinnamomum micranthum f. kanehirae]